MSKHNDHGFNIERLPNGSSVVRAANAGELSDYAALPKHFVTTHDGILETPVAKSGLASKPGFFFTKCIQTCAEIKPDKHALKWEKPDGTLDSWTWAYYWKQINTFSRALIEIGMPKFGSVAIMGFNSRHWFVSNLGAMNIGAKSAGIYTTSDSSICTYIVEHSEATVVCFDDLKHLDKFNDSAAITHFVYWGKETPNADLKARLGDRFFTWDNFMALGHEKHQKVVDQRRETGDPRSCCILVYTSGTTGLPKGAMISHDALCFVGEMGKAYLHHRFSPEEEVVSYLPLSHIAAQVVDIVLPTYVATFPKVNVCVTFAKPDALKGSLGETLKKVRPTYFFAVPRVYEKMMQKMIEVKESKNIQGVKLRLVEWAKGVGLETYRRGVVSGDHGKPFGHFLAEKLVFHTVWGAVGLDRCSDACFSGGAPMSRQCLEYFGQIGIPIHELYGLSETAGLGCINTWKAREIVCTGQVPSGTEVMIFHDKDRDKVGEGEICFRARNVMMGYLKDEQKSKEAIDPEGWLHTGDVGRVDDNAMVYITGRIKELLITAGGENVAPVPIEEAFKELCPFVSNCMVVGDREKFLVILVCLRSEQNSDETFSTKLDKKGLGVGGSSATTTTEAQKDPKYRKVIEEAMMEYNKKRATSNAQKVQKFEILERDFSVPSNELTATLKLKRNVVLKNNEKIIAKLYEANSRL
eukprot:Platyproteum_vivax@DN4469_c0_g1_i1.p1